MTSIVARMLDRALVQTEHSGFANYVKLFLLQTYQDTHVVSYCYMFALRSIIIYIHLRRSRDGTVFVCLFVCSGVCYPRFIQFAFGQLCT